MADDVKVPINRDNAVLLLAAARELELDTGVVRTTSQGHFLVPQEVADKAGPGDDTEPKPAKKTAAKKTAAKKTATKKVTAKKTTAKGQE